MLRKALNHSESAHRQAAAFVIGSAAQSNPAVQAAAAESGLLHSLCQAYPGEAEAGVRKKLLFALSGILRNFPAAQKKFLQLGGYDLGSLDWPWDPHPNSFPVRTCSVWWARRRRRWTVESGCGS